MISPNMTRAEMIKWLGDAISAETEKPFDKIDYDFVDECGQLLDKLMGKSAAVSEDEIAKEIVKLIPNTNTRVRKGMAHKRLWRVAIIAAVVLCMSITVLAVPQLRTMLMEALKLNIGETVEGGGVTYIYNGKGTTYQDLDTLISAENLDMLYFNDPDGVLKIATIDYIDTISTTTITFNDETIDFKITHNINAISDTTKNNCQIISKQNFEAYVTSKEVSGITFYNAYIYYSNDTYSIKCSSESMLNTILNSLTKGE